MRNRLLPAFKVKYKNKKMILILDNAKYHHARGEDWITPSKMNRIECGVFFRRVGFTCIKEDGKDDIPESKFTADRCDGGPTIKLMREVITSYVKSHPAINTTLIEQIMS